MGFPALFCSGAELDLLQCKFSWGTIPTSPFWAWLFQHLKICLTPKIYSQTVYTPLFLCHCCPHTVRFLLYISASSWLSFLCTSREQSQPLFTWVCWANWSEVPICIGHRYPSYLSAKLGYSTSRAAVFTHFLPSMYSFQPPFRPDVLTWSWTVPVPSAVEAGIVPHWPALSTATPCCISLQRTLKDFSFSTVLSTPKNLSFTVSVFYIRTNQREQNGLEPVLYQRLSSSRNICESLP